MAMDHQIPAIASQPPRTHKTSVEGFLLSGIAPAVPENLHALLAHDKGDPFWIAGMLQTIKIDIARTAGKFGLVELCVPQGRGSPWHVHPDEDESFYVLEGELTVYVGDVRLVVTPGSFAFGPRGIPHTFLAESPGGAKALAGFTPMLFEGFLKEGADPAPRRAIPPPPDREPDWDRLRPIAIRNGFEILGPPGPPPKR